MALPSEAAPCGLTDVAGAGGGGGGGTGGIADFGIRERFRFPVV